jgi:hypothetical protein
MHDATFARPLFTLAARLYHLRPRIIRLDAAYWACNSFTGSMPRMASHCSGSLESQVTEKPLVFTASAGGTRGNGPAAVLSNASRGRVFLFFHEAPPATLRLVSHHSTGRASRTLPPSWSRLPAEPAGRASPHPLSSARFSSPLGARRGIEESQDIEKETRQRVSTCQEATLPNQYSSLDSLKHVCS